MSGWPCLYNAYMAVHEKPPLGLQDWEIADSIKEVLDDPRWIPNSLARECIYTIVCLLDFPDRAIRERIIYVAEEAARKVFPELAHIDEVHMDQVEWAYQKSLMAGRE